MARLLRLETFDMPATGSRLPEQMQSELEEIRLSSYETGYAAGWDDAVGAQSGDISRLRADLGRNLTAMALSYQEARQHILAALEPLLQSVVGKVLPAIARQTLGQMILEEIRPHAETMASAPVIVRIAPENREMVAQLLSAETDLPIEVAEEPTLGPGQAYLTLGQAELEVDLDGVVDAIAAAVSTFFQIEGEKD
ncbi:MAG: flagellar biosynthesis protein [Paracoccaceae bacterium]